MKRILYKFISAEINHGTKEEPNIEIALLEKSLPYVDGAIELAQREAYNGEYTIENDGQPEPTQAPTQLDRVEAQATYTAMMTDTLLESEV